jgi:hypothetical protein
MPGSYAHITLGNLASEKRRLQGINDFPREAIDAANLHTNLLELGCISPDYPYLDIGSGDAKKWADAMHYTHTCRAVYEAAEFVRALDPGLPKDKCLAWLMGYASHVIADMCIHPVIEIKVGTYNGHETAHRRCEMHQDAYIFRRIGTGMPQTANHLKATILACGDPANPALMDQDVKNAWQTLLGKVYPDIFSTDPPDVDTWHRKCDQILQRLLPTSSQFIGFARHVCDGLGFSYPTPDTIDMAAYIDSLAVPAPAGTARRMHYDDIFNFAIERVQEEWVGVTRHALGLGDFIPYRNEEWDLDTGINKLDADELLVFWRIKRNVQA